MGISDSMSFPGIEYPREGNVSRGIGGRVSEDRVSRGGVG